MDIGIIGFGNMGRALAAGLAASGFEGRIFASARNGDKLRQNAAALGVQPADNREAAQQSDLVILAVKPYLVETVVRELGGALQNKVVVCVAAGIRFDALSALLPASARAVCVLPNTPAAVCRGVFCCEKKHSLTADDRAMFEAAFSPLGLILYLDEKELPAASAVAGCGPAFAALFLEALADAAVRHGLNRADAYRVSAHMLAGTAALQIHTGKHPAQMKDEVCSPGGITIRGVAALEEKGFRSAVLHAVGAAMP